MLFGHLSGFSKHRRSRALASSYQTPQKVSAIAAVFAGSCSGLSPQLGGKISMELARCHSGSTHSRT